MSAGKLPDGWTRVKFGDVVRNANETSRDLAGDGLDRVVGLDHLDPGSLRLVRWDSLEELPDGTTFTRRFKPGQVLFGKRRAYQRKVAVPDFEGVCSGDILVFEPSNELMLAEFLPYLVQSDGFFDHALGTSAGSLSPRTKWADLARYEFALPPIDEQLRVVETMGRVETFQSAVSRARESHARLVLAMSSSYEALETPLVDRLDPRRKIAYGVLKPDSGGDDGVPMVRVQDLVEGVIEVTPDMSRVSLRLADEFSRTCLHEGDVLVSVVGTVGRVSIVGSSLVGANVSRAIAVLAPSNPADSRLLAAILSMAPSQKWIESHASGGVQRVLNLGSLRELPLRWPTDATEDHLRQVLQRLEDARRWIETVDATSRSVQSSLLNSLLGVADVH